MSFYEITKLDRFIWTKYSQDDIFVIACEGTLGEYDCCTYYGKGTGYTGWEGDAEEPCLWFYTYLYEGENYVGAGYDTVYWNKADASSISSPKAGASASDRITSLSGINYSQSAKLPAGLYVKNGKKVLVTK